MVWGGPTCRGVQASPCSQCAPPRAASVVVEDAVGQIRFYKLVMRKVFCLGAFLDFRIREKGVGQERS